MMRRQIHRSRSSNGGTGYLAAGRKKTVLATGLVTIMAIMWFRVLTGRKPESAAAAKPPETPQKKTGAVAKFRFHDLPIIPGRNDRINRNFFAVENWTGFSEESSKHSASTGSEVQIVTPNRTQEVIVKVAQKLKLAAVLWSENPQIFANDQLLRVGDTLELKEGTDTYVFEVIQIEADSVLVRCREQELTLKLAQSNDVND
ncbi:MAG: hypothetical protein JSW27_23495 [Phycisphaerales bacterium]|nr:MAG: hypothetical protein JSW27_23495 [Phycisphaerales bacterium]